MTTPTRRYYEHPPKILTGYAHALWPRKTGLQPGQVVPGLECELMAQKPDRRHLRDYQWVCGFAESGVMPATYPHVLAVPLHLDILTDPTFPFPAFGLIHIRQRIVQKRLIQGDEPLHLVARIGGHREGVRGIEIDLLTEATSAGQSVWQGTSTLLSRRVEPAGAERPAKPQDIPVDDWHDGSEGEVMRHTIEVGEDIGRRYAWASGDYNPIHLHAYSAKMFGFPRAIAHGAWTLARCLAALPTARERLDIEVEFRKPVLLPTVTALEALKSYDGTRFRLTSQDGKLEHLRGEIR
jgi:acyl dehydratase